MMNKDKAIEEAMASIENRIRHVYNQGFEKGYAKGKEKPEDEYEIVKKYCDSRCLTLVDSTYLQCLAGFTIVPSAQLESILDKIKSEIENDWQLKKYPSSPFSCGLRRAMEIIDKCKAESEESDE